MNSISVRRHARHREQTRIKSLPQRVSKIAQAILDCIEKFKQIPEIDCAEDINHGYCDLFAECIRTKVPDARIHQWDREDGKPANHDFIEYRGRFYDAEAPGGVDDYRDLPIFEGMRLPPAKDIL